ncbi:MAG: LCP family protein [Oscillospiraceae bacterium]|jgi:LCP family protein required for cell wall assembly|nr:LCP family protein [Oscillospiraceae bacterium]
MAKVNWAKTASKTSAAKGKKTKKEKKKFSQLTPAERKKKLLKIGAEVLAVILVLAIGVGFGVSQILKAMNTDESGRTANPALDAENLFHDKDVLNVLIVGVDGRKSDGNGLSDVMMLVSINKKQKTTTMVSFLRDTWVDIPGYKTAKMNAAGSHGGPSLVMDTIEHNFRVKVDHYVLVTFEAFRKVVDAVGGVSVPIKANEAKEINRYAKKKEPAKNINVAAGDDVLLNGEEALYFVRVRKQDTDWQRTNRQQILLKAIVEKAKANPTKVLGALQGMLSEMKTDMTGTDVGRAALLAPNIMSYEIVNKQIPAENTWKYQSVGGQSVIMPDIPKNVQALKSWLYP